MSNDFPLRENYVKKFKPFRNGPLKNRESVRADIFSRSFSGKRGAQRSHKHENRRAFTLIEVLVVIGIIAILAAVVLVAVNPARQFKLARDSQRTANVEAILNAIHENMAEHRGTFTCNGIPAQLPNIATDVRAGASAGDIAACVVPDYLASLPFDPSAPGAHYTGPGDYDTQYMILQDTDGRLTVSAVGELTPVISATR